MRQVLRIDADRDIGYGHAVRVAALVEKLPAAETIVCGHVDRLEHLFPGCKQIDAPADPRACVQLIRSLAAGLVLCDSPLLSPAFWPAAHALAPARMVAVDDYGGPVQADLVVNGTVLPEYHRYPALRGPAMALCGGRYALLRSCFRGRAWTEPLEQRLTVVAGSGPRAARWIGALATAGFFASHGSAVRLVVGWGFSNAELVQRLRSSGVVVHVGMEGPELAQLLTSSTLLLATGGMIVYEALALGVPSIILPQEDNLLAEAAWFASRGAIVDLGPMDDRCAARTAAVVADLWNDPSSRQRLAARAASVIDGAGTQRVAAHIAQLLARQART